MAWVGFLRPTPFYQPRASLLSLPHSLPSKPAYSLPLPLSPPTPCHPLLLQGPCPSTGLTPLPAPYSTPCPLNQPSPTSPLPSTVPSPCNLKPKSAPPPLHPPCQLQSAHGPLIVFTSGQGRVKISSPAPHLTWGQGMKCRTCHALQIVQPRMENGAGDQVRGPTQRTTMGPHQYLPCPAFFAKPSPISGALRLHINFAPEMPFSGVC